jgi:hypothetical protein
MRTHTRLFWIVLVVALALGVVGCEASVGVGVYGPMTYGPWGTSWGGVYVGGPIYP